MDIEHLREFVVLAKYGKLGPAARELALSPSTLSSHISALEAELGGPLFERLDGFELTQAGEEALDHVQAIFSEIDAIKRSCSRQSGESLTLRMPNYFFGQKPLTVVRDVFLESHPGCNVFFKTNELQMSSPVDILQEGLTDLAYLSVVKGQKPEPTDILPSEIERIEFGVTTYVYIVPAGHRLADRGALDIGDLDGETLMFTLNPLVGYVIEGMRGFFEDRGCGFNVQYRRVHQHKDIFLASLADAVYPWPVGYESVALDRSPDATVHRAAFDMPIEMYLLYMPSRLSPLQLEYVECIKREAAKGPLV